MSIRTESEILTGFVSGDSQILREIYTAYFPKVVGYVTKNSGTKDDAKDVFQDALVFTYQRLTSGSLHLQCALANYVFAVSKNMWMNILRKKQKELVFDTKPELSADLGNGVLDALEEQEKMSLYHKHFLKLGESCQTLLRHFFLGRSMTEIANLMGYSPAYARKKKFECKQKLLEMIETDPLYKELSLTEEEFQVK